MEVWGEVCRVGVCIKEFWGEWRNQCYMANERESWARGDGDGCGILQEVYVPQSGIAS